MTREWRSKPVRNAWLPALLVIGLFGSLITVRAVTEPKNDFRFSIMGDRTGGAQPQIWGRVWREVDLLHPDFVINVGDTIQGGKDELAGDEWRELRPVWQRYSHYPLYFTPGNHDVFSDTSRKIYERESKRPSYYSFNYQDAHFTVLDNSRTTDLSEEQIAFLARDLGGVNYGLTTSGADGYVTLGTHRSDPLGGLTSSGIQLSVVSIETAQ